jgi:TPR repeat protein
MQHKNMNKKNIRRKMTDVELCIELAPAAGDAYRRALEVITAYPDYAKTNFRIVTEHLTIKLGKHFGIAVENLDLFSSIQKLFNCQVIDNNLRDELHRIRTLGNAVVHANQKNADAGADNAYKARGAGNLESALSARSTLVGILESVFLLTHKDEEAPAITALEVGDFTSQQTTLWKAISSLDFESKMAAGLILEAQSLAPLPKGALVVSNSQYAHKQTNRKMAAELYWVACVISAGVDTKSQFNIHKMEEEDAFLFRHANTEALFRYSQLTFDQKQDEENQKRGVKALEAAAKRDYIDAMAEYGNWLREEGRFDEAFEVFSYALEKGQVSAHVGLGFLYLEKTYSGYSQKLAEQCFLNGINSGYDHCTYVLGRFLYEGTDLVQDKERGKALLKSAADAGHELAAHYFNFCVDDRLAKDLQALGLKILQSLPKLPEAPKQGRNEPCACKSGRKYKKCCGA